jgi:hypothetical protein
MKPYGKREDTNGFELFRDMVNWRVLVLEMLTLKILLSVTDSFIYVS